MLEPRKCKICGKLFLPAVGNQIKCPVCRDKKRPPRPMVKKVCKECGKPFETNIYNREYCSRECREHHNYTPDRISKTCEMCGKSFYTTKNNQKYCSPDCSDISFKRSMHKYYEKRKLLKQQQQTGGQ